MQHATDPNQGNPYLSGLYAPINSEIVADDLQVIGEIPKDLAGVYLRNGPNPRYRPKGRYHWFDGDGMIHALRFSNGKAAYRNAWVRTRGFLAEEKEKRSLFSGLIEPDFKNPLGPLKDSANTDVLFHNGHVLGLWYRGGEAYLMDPETLETKGPTSFGGKLEMSISAHAKVDPATGELLLFHYGPKPPYLYYGSVSPNGELKSWIPVETPGQRFPHDMAFTKDYAILMDFPVFFNPDALAKGKWRMDFFPELPSRFAVVRRDGGPEDIRWFDAEPCYIYHVINAWQQGDEIILDGCRVDQPIPPRNPNDSELDRMLKFLKLDARLYRWTFNLKTGKTTEAQRDDRNTEFPSINNRFMGRASRYAYNMTIPDADTLLFDGIAKYDTTDGSAQIHHFGPHVYGSEAPFAPRCGATEEDDGYLVSFVHNEAEDRSECRVFHARHLTDGPIARVLIPQRVPLGYHAAWVPGENPGGV